MIKIAIVDADLNNIKREYRIIKTYMKKNNYQYNVEIYISGNDFLKNYISINQFDIVFMDVYMPDKNGFDIAKELRKKYGNYVTIIFVSSDINHSPEAFKVKAFRFILKTSTDFDDNIFESINSFIECVKYIEYHYEKN